MATTASNRHTSSPPQIPPQMFPAARRQTTKHIVQSWMGPLNEWADEYFYNVTDEDKQAVHDRAKDPGTLVAGSIVYVAPGQPPRFFPDVVAFLSTRERLHEEVGALCVPGVGSSALGAAGLARDVSIARDVPVAGVVAGYGLRELLNDALGGAVCFRETNELEFALENMRRNISSMVGGFGLLPAIETLDSLGGGPAIQSVKALLRGGRLPHLEFVVGHSKGNMVISGAVGELVCENAPIQRLKQATIVLLSALCALPANVGRQVQIIGELDPLGWANSRLGVDATVVPNAAHHLNRSIPLFLDAVRELKAF